MNDSLSNIISPLSLSLSLQVKDSSEYNFEPRELVSGIIDIYLNLGREEIFCAALPRDGRSFSMDLFTQGERVLRSVSV